MSLSVIGDNNVGGLTGGSGSSIQDCYFVGKVTAVSEVGNLVGNIAESVTSGIYDYVSSQYIAIDGESNMCYQPRKYQVICSRLNVREGPATSYRIKSRQELSPSAQAQGSYQMGVNLPH